MTMRKSKKAELTKRAVELMFTDDEYLNIRLICRANYLDLNQFCRIAVKHLLTCPTARASNVLDLKSYDEE